MNGVTYRFQWPLHIDDGRFFCSCVELIFFHQKIRDNFQLYPAQKGENDLMGHSVYFIAQKRVGIRNFCQGV